MISVIIPVYNAAPFVEECVQSALKQPEVSEVIIVEDGSTDSSLKVCEKISNENKFITLLRHPEGANKGAGASRNLGIRHAKNEWIAFLDADDYFLTDRFKHTLEYLKKNPDIQAIGEPIGAVFHDAKGKNQYLEHLNLPNDTQENEIVNKLQIDVPYELTFETLFCAENGYQSIIGLIVNKRVFENCGFLNEKLKIAQDTNFLMRLAYSCPFKCLSDSPIISIRRIHSGNRWNASLKRRLYFYALHIQDLYKFVDLNSLSKKASRKMIWAYVRSHKTLYFQSDFKFMKLYYASQAYLYLIVNNPRLLFKAYI